MSVRVGDVRAVGDGFDFARVRVEAFESGLVRVTNDNGVVLVEWPAAFLEQTATLEWKVYAGGALVVTLIRRGKCCGG